MLRPKLDFLLFIISWKRLELLSCMAYENRTTGGDKRGVSRLR